MIGKKDTKCIFEQYRQVLKEQVEDNKINALLNALKSSNLDPKFRDSLINLLKDPEVISKWKGGDADTVNAGDSNFAKEMAAAQKAQNLAYPEQNDEEQPRKFDYKTGRYEGESDRDRYERLQRDAKVLGSFGK